MNRPTARQKRRQLEARGWSEKRILQYMKDWGYTIKPTRNPKSTKNGCASTPKTW